MRLYIDHQKSPNTQLGYLRGDGGLLIEEKNLQANNGLIVNPNKSILNCWFESVGKKPLYPTISQMLQSQEHSLIVYLFYFMVTY
jgi:hypothetical protein